MRTALPPRDLAMIAIVVFAWGSNFSAMKIALEELPATVFVGLRFAILIPLIAVLPRPKATWTQILAIGALINTGQFAFLFSAMEADISAGLASLILQSQAPLTMLLAVLFFGERMSLRQGIGIAVAAIGMGLIGAASGGNVTLWGLILVLCGALSWAFGNLVFKGLSGAPMLPIFVWASLVPPFPMLGLAFATGNEPLMAIAELSPSGWLAVIYVAMISTVIGYSLWGALLARHPAARVTPFALLIPVVGIIVAALVLGESLSTTEAIGALVVLIGIAFTVLVPKDAANGQA